MCKETERDVCFALCSPLFAPRPTSQNEPPPGLLTRPERFAGQGVDGRIGATLGERCWWRREATGKEKVEQEHGIGQVDRTTIINVSTLGASRFLSYTE